MKSRTHLVEQHILQHRAHTAHQDELMEYGSESFHPDVNRLKNPDDFERETMARAGPMGIWDLFARKVEQVVERFEHRH